MALRQNSVNTAASPLSIVIIALLLCFVSQPLQRKGKAQNNGQIIFLHLYGVKCHPSQKENEKTPSVPQDVKIT
jgi:hypothetical protein